MKSIKKGALALVIGFSLVSPAYAASNGESFTSGVVKNVLKNYLVTFAALWSSTVVHELGHAVAVKGCGYGLESINIGQEKGESLFSCFDTFHIRSFSPLCSGSVVYHHSGEVQPYKLFMVAAAGPAAEVSYLAVLLRNLDTVEFLGAKLAIVFGLYWTVKCNVTPDSQGANDGSMMKKAWDKMFAHKAKKGAGSS